MPFTRYQIRSEYGLADPELYRDADKDDPEALLEGVAMAGLVGILRQLGDLAEFAAEMFHDLHEEVMTTAARGHAVMVRVQQLEAEFPSVEKAFLSRTDCSLFFSNTGVDWRPNVQLEQSLITRGDLPRCVMDSYEECRGPPRLFHLDKFDVAGAGACLKRYTDPSFFRLATSSSEASLAEIQREKKSHRAKKRGSKWRNGGTPEIAPTSHAKLHDLFLEERVQGVHADPTRLVKLKTRKLDGYALSSKSGESYMEKFVQMSVDHGTSYERIASSPELLTWNMDDAKDSVTEIPEISTVGDVEKSSQGTETEVSSPNEQENIPTYNLNGDFIDKDMETVPDSTHGEAEEIASSVSDRIVEKDLQTNLNGVPENLQYTCFSENLTSEVDNYVDAPATMESETEIDDDGRPRNRSDALGVVKHDSDSDVYEDKIEDPPQFSDSQSVRNTSASENGRSLFLRWRSSYSHSDAANISTENDLSDGEKTAEFLPSTGTCKSEPVEFTSDVTHGNKDAQESDSGEQELINGNDVDRQASCTSPCTSSSPRSVSQISGSHSSIVQSLAQNDPKKGGSDESSTGPVDSSTSGTLLDVTDPSFSSEVWLAVSSSEGNRYDTAIDDTTKTNCEVDYMSENLANSTTDSRQSDVSPMDQRSPCLDDDLIAAADIHSNNNLDDERENVTVTKVISEVHSQTAVADLSNEHSPTFGTTTDDFVSESHEVTLVNGTLMPTEVIDSKMTSDVFSEDKKSMRDASPTYSTISGECHSSFVDDNGFHDPVSLDTEAPDIVLKEELATSGNDADTACSDGNQIESKCSSTSTCSPLIITSDKTYEIPSGAGEFCRDKVLESDKTFLAECNPELERNTQTNPLEGTLEGLDIVQHSSPVALDDNDLENGESLTLRTSLDSVSLDLEKSIEVHKLSANHVLTDEEYLRSDVCQGLSSESNSSAQALNHETTFPGLGLIPKAAPPSLEEIPPLPPLPPMQWFVGKVQHSSSPALSRESVENITSPLSAAPPVGSSLNTQLGFSPKTLEGGRSEQFPAEFVNNASEEHNSVTDHPVQCHELHHDKPTEDQDLNDMSERISRSSRDSDRFSDTKARTPTQSTEAEEEGQSVPCALDGETAEPSSSSVQKMRPGSSVGDAMWPVNAFALAPISNSEKPNEIPTVKLPRPRSPLVDAVAAHDRSTMRKVPERVRLPTESKEEGKNSFLAQIRNKSINLKPAGMARPNIQAGPKTNLKVAAILEKANTIRQAMAGSDEDDDSDSWSDS
ncbi:PREDICTED: protein SCAR2-like [Tarenaya hassleriana]|uniref:protein SCAR2-like n=1 Tax=Tarenaya hassleriana TaxID=28532 RepID=UPI00053C0C9A|nr:PREDICTED: protein SCAR2-like [Tarenaya hassleriana]